VILSLFFLAVLCTYLFAIFYGLEFQRQKTKSVESFVNRTYSSPSQFPSAFPTLITAKPSHRPNTKFVHMDNGHLCTHGSKMITDEEECRSAAQFLKLAWGGPFRGVNDFPYCALHSHKHKSGAVRFNTVGFEATFLLEPWASSFRPKARIFKFDAAICKYEDEISTPKVIKELSKDLKYDDGRHIGSCFVSGLPDTDMEYDYLSETFDLPRISSSCETRIGENHIFVQGLYHNCLQEVRGFTNGEKAIIFHTGDETGRLTYGYDDPRVVKIFRSYYHPHVAESYSDLVYFPVGYGRNFTGLPSIPNLPPSQREFNWAFYGNINECNRKDMDAAMQTVPKGSSRMSQSWKNGNLPAEQMKRILQNAIFCPTPSGWQIPDSFRFTEVLEAGCIPIICRNQEDPNPSWGDTVQYFDEFFQLSGTPLSDDIIQVNVWADAPPIVMELLKDINSLDERYRRIEIWYNKYKATLRSKVDETFREYCS